MFEGSMASPSAGRQGSSVHAAMNQDRDRRGWRGVEIAPKGRARQSLTTLHGRDGR